MLESLWAYSRELREDSLELRAKVETTHAQAGAVRDRLGRGAVPPVQAVEAASLTKA